MSTPEEIDFTRSQAIRELGVLNGQRDARLDQTVELAARICDAPVSLITLIDGPNQWFKACFGTNLDRTPKAVSFCTYTILQENLEEAFVIPDMHLDDRFCNNPLVTAAPFVRFYAGVALVTRAGVPLGSLCVVDLKPRELSPQQTQTLKILAKSVMAQMELHQFAVQLQAQKELLSTVISVLPTGVYWKDKKSVYLGCNQNFADAAGISRPQDIVGKTDADLPARAKDRRHFLALETQVLNGRSSLVDQREMCAGRDSEVRQFETRNTALRDATGNTIGVVGTFADITGHYRVAEELRTAREKAENANNAKTEFLAQMSHEIRTPLNGVIGMANLLLRDEQSSEEKLRYLRGMKCSADALLGLINDVLDISKIEAGKLELNTVEFSLRQMVEDVIEMFAARASSGGIRLRYAIDRWLPDQMFGDHDRLQQVLINLVSNAIKFTRRGGVTIQVCPCDIESHKGLSFAVVDTGAGISLERVKELFLPYSQVDEATANRRGSSGLGLAICKSLVEMMGGTIGVESVVGKGTTFHFSTPLGTPTESYCKADDSADVALDLEITPTLAERETPHLPILLAEDDPTSRLVAFEVLKHAGYRVDLVSTGPATIAAVQRKEYAAILLDCQLPDLDGFAVARQIRVFEKQCGTARPLPIVALTANAMTENRDQCLEAGMNLFLTKPIDPQAFIGAIRSLIHAEHNNIERVDTETLRNHLLNDTGLAAMLLEKFAVELPERIVGLTDAFDAGDLPRLIYLSHVLVGAASSLSIEVMGSLARQLERCCRADDLPGAAEVIERIQKLEGSTSAAARQVATQLSEETRQAA